VGIPLFDLASDGVYRVPVKIGMPIKSAPEMLPFLR